MFWVRLAFRKLTMNPKRTLFKIAFFGAVFSVILLLLLFMGGADAQMKSAMRRFLGDADIAAREADASLAPMLADIRARYSGEFADVQESYIAQLRLCTDRTVCQSACSGVKPDFSAYLNGSVSWLGKGPGSIEEGAIYLEASVAEALSCGRGDTLTAQWNDAKSGRANTAQLKVSGVFVGSNQLFSGASFMTLEGMRSLVLDETASNRVKLYFKTGDKESIRGILRAINEVHYDLAQIGSIALDPSGGPFGIYKYYNMLVSFVAWMLVIVFFVIMNFSNQNLFFSEYRGRRDELVTFLTYGMKPGELRRIVAWEALFQTVFSLAAASVFSAAAAFVISRYRITRIEYGDLITAIGGPRIAFAVDMKTIPLALVFIALIMLYSALKGANRYLKREIRDIAGSAY